MSNDHKYELENIHDLNANELLEIIGREISKGQMGLGKEDPEEYIDRAKRWLSMHKEKLHKKICNSHVAKVANKNQSTSDHLLLIASVADLISELTLGVAPIVVSGAIVKLGLKSLCEES